MAFIVKRERVWRGESLQCPLRPAPRTLSGEAVYCLTLILNWWENGSGRREALFPLSIEPKEQLERENPKILSERCQNTGKSGKKLEALLRNCRHGFDLSTFEKSHKQANMILTFQLLTSLAKVQSIKWQFFAGFQRGEKSVFHFKRPPRVGIKAFTMATF